MKEKLFGMQHAKNEDLAIAYFMKNTVFAKDELTVTRLPYFRNDAAQILKASQLFHAMDDFPDKRGGTGFAVLEDIFMDAF